MEKNYFYDIKILIFIPIFFMLLNYGRINKTINETILYILFSLVYLFAIIFFLNKNETYRIINNGKIMIMDVLYKTIRDMFQGAVIVFTFRLLQQNISYTVDKEHMVMRMLAGLITVIGGEFTFRNLLCVNIRHVTKSKAVAIVLSSIFASLACYDIILALYMIPLNIDNAETLLNEDNVKERLIKNVLFTFFNFFINL